MSSRNARPCSKPVFSFSQDYFSEPELAAYLRLSVAALRNWRRKAQGPPFTKLCGKNSPVFYRRGAVTEWLNSAEKEFEHK